MNDLDHAPSMLPAIIKGSIGIAATFGGAGVSMLSQIEAWLRIGSLCVGICVGLLTIRSILKGSSKSQPTEKQ